MEKNDFSINSSLPDINKVNDSFDEWLSAELNVMLSPESKSIVIEEFKVITYELMSNWIIHNESPTIEYFIDVNGNKVELSVLIGKGFQIKPMFSNENGLVFGHTYSPKLINKSITFYDGIDYKVNCLVVDENQIKFKYFRTKDSEINIDTLPDSFTYSRMKNETASYKFQK